MGLGAGRPDSPGKDGEVILTQDGIDQKLSFYGLNPPGVKNDISCACVGGKLAPPNRVIHEACYWEMNNFLTRKCNS